MNAEEVDYDDWSDTELAEELEYLDKRIQDAQTKLAITHKSMNRDMHYREDVIDIIKQRAGKKGWQR